MCDNKLTTPITPQLLRRATADHKRQPRAGVPPREAPRPLPVPQPPFLYPLPSNATLFDYGQYHPYHAAQGEGFDRRDVVPVCREPRPGPARQLHDVVHPAPPRPASPAPSVPYLPVQHPFAPSSICHS
ncbi:unnamed protein product [Plutella xylostella]|uniref:(diamondback moth) hypothetical protein n=1 Tax=Plutella xylostella TaxID=51655 RepID=A0A8S4FXG5_PLUXY|nr:unnamed protein product [Plutella xylostella]